VTQNEIDNLSGIDLLRLIVRNADHTRESFWDDKTPEQIVQIGRMLLSSGWDIYPDEWTERQVQEALAGKPPRWNRDEEPVYD
jgi:hypothetical protein